MKELKNRKSNKKNRNSFFFKRNSLTILFLSLFGLATYAQQVKILSDDTSPIDFKSFAILELSADSQGFILPRVDSLVNIDPSSLSEEAEGLFAYSRKDSTLYYRTKTEWVKIGAGEESLNKFSLKESQNDSIVVWDGDTLRYRTIENLITDEDATKALAHDSTFVMELAHDSTFTTELSHDSTFATELASDSIFISVFSENIGRDTLEILNVDTIVSRIITSDTLYSSKATFDTLHSELATFDTLYSSQATFDTLRSELATFDTARIKGVLILDAISEKNSDSVLVWDGDTVGYRVFSLDDADKSYVVRGNLPDITYTTFPYSNDESEYASNGNPEAIIAGVFETASTLPTSPQTIFETGGRVTGTHILIENDSLKVYAGSPVGVDTVVVISYNSLLADTKYAFALHLVPTSKEASLYVAMGVDDVGNILVDSLRWELLHILDSNGYYAR